MPIFKIDRTQIRSSLDVEFLDWSEADEAYIQTTYGDSGMRVAFVRELSPDGLCLIRRNTWASYDDYLTYIEDPRCSPYFIARDEYNSANGIISYSEVV
jgi:hypothetical protein